MLALAAYLWLGTISPGRLTLAPEIMEAFEVASPIQCRPTPLFWASLEGVDPRLAAVAILGLCYSDVEFKVIEGVRTKERQARLVRAKKSWTMNSRHLTGHAVDLMPVGDLNGDDVINALDRNITWKKENFLPIAEAMKRAAKELGVEIEWGGDWKRQDMPHFQLS